MDENKASKPTSESSNQAGNPFGTPTHQPIVEQIKQKANTDKHLEPTPSGMPSESFVQRVLPFNKKAKGSRFRTRTIVIVTIVAIVAFAIVSSFISNITSDIRHRNYYNSLSDEGKLAEQIDDIYSDKIGYLYLSFEEYSTSSASVLRDADNNIEELDSAEPGSEIFAGVIDNSIITSNEITKQYLTDLINVYDETIAQLKVIANDYRQLVTITASINRYYDFAQNPDQIYMEEMTNALKRIIADSADIQLNYTGAQTYLNQLSIAANNIIADYELSGSGRLNLQLGDWNDFAQACAGLRDIYSDKTVQEYEDSLWEAKDKLVSQLRDPSILPNY